MILGLDLGVNLGWVLGDATGPMRRGTFECENTTDLGVFLHSTDRFFQAVMPLARGIAVEQPFLGESYYPARKALALLGHVYYWGRVYGIGASQIKEIPVSTGKLTLSGFGHADKDQMIAAAARLGYEDFDEHQADALGIWWCYVFGRREAARPKRVRSGKPTVIKP